MSCCLDGNEIILVEIAFPALSFTHHDEAHYLYIAHYKTFLAHNISLDVIKCITVSEKSMQ